MRLEKNDIDRLINEEIAGEITPEGAALLKDAIENDPELYILWVDKHKTFEEKDINEWLNVESKAPSVSAIESGEKSRRLKIKVRYAISSAAILLVAIGSLFIYRITNAPSPNPEIAKNTSSTIQLKLENGKVIDLSQEGKVEAGNISLNNQQQSLTYSSGNNPASQEWAILSVPAGKDYKITLSDGTEIFMNSATSLRFPISFSNSPTREVTLTGEAYLKVSKDPNRPFKVKMQHASVQVIGTEFNVSSYENENLQVALVEGKVQLKAGEDSIILKPGFSATYSGKGSIYAEPFDAGDLLSWRKGIYPFNDKALEEVFRIIPRWFGQDVIFDDPKVGKEHFTGVFDRNKTIQKNLDVLKAYNGIDYYVDANNVIHIK